MWPLLIFTISSLGFLSLLKHIVSFLNWFYTYFLRTPKNLLTTYGSWAIVTGSTDGIGKALAFCLAKEGHHLLLVGRNPEKLKQVTNQIHSTSPQTDIKTLVLDFSGDLKDGVGRLRKAITGLDVGILINNAGMTYPSAMYFHEVDEQLWRNVIKVNLEGLSMVTKAVLPGMLKRNRGAIVNIGSGASSAIPSHPLFAVYAATKAYVESFTRSLHVEYKHQGIDVQCQIPMYVATKMVPFKSGSSFFTPSPDRFAKAAVRRIGYESRCTPYWTHSLQWWLASWPPDAALNAWRLRHGLSRRINHNSERASPKRFS